MVFSSLLFTQTYSITLNIDNLHIHLIQQHIHKESENQSFEEFYMKDLLAYTLNYLVILYLRASSTETRKTYPPTNSPNRDDPFVHSVRGPLETMQVKSGCIPGKA